MEVSAPAEAEEVVPQQRLGERPRWTIKAAAVRRKSRGEATVERRKRWTTGVGYSGRAALRREQCDVHAVGK
jgi:hypothetical protein